MLPHFGAKKKEGWRYCVYNSIVLMSEIYRYLKYTVQGISKQFPIYQKFQQFIKSSELFFSSIITNCFITMQLSNVWAIRSSSIQSVFILVLVLALAFPFIFDLVFVLSFFFVLVPVLVPALSLVFVLVLALFLASSSSLPLPLPQIYFRIGQRTPY